LYPLSNVIKIPPPKERNLKIKDRKNSPLVDAVHGSGGAHLCRAHHAVHRGPVGTHLVGRRGAKGRAGGHAERGRGRPAPERLPRRREVVGATLRGRRAPAVATGARRPRPPAPKVGAE